MRKIVGILLAAAGCMSGEGVAQQAVDYRDLCKDVAIIGQLGVPLGSVVEIEVTVVAGRTLRSKALESEYLLKVSKVGANSVVNRPVCQFHTHPWAEVKLAPDTFSLYKLRHGKKAGRLLESDIAELERGYVGQSYRLLVYEVGGFSGIPSDLPRDYPLWQDRPFGFQTYLVVVRILEGSEKLDQQDGAKGK